MDSDALSKIKEIINRLDSPHADKIFVAKEYTKADLRRDLLIVIELAGPARDLASPPITRRTPGWSRAAKDSS